MIADITVVVEVTTGAECMGGTVMGAMAMGVSWLGGRFVILDGAGAGASRGSVPWRDDIGVSAFVISSTPVLISSVVSRSWLCHARTSSCLQLGKGMFSGIASTACN